MTYPLNAGAASPAARPASPGAEPMPSALIVEDEPEANRLLAMLVRLRGHATTSAFTGAEALDRARAEAPDLVFLDLMLPDRDGLGVCQALKADPATTAIPVIMVTARLAPENRLRGFRAGATDYVPKPYTPDQIFAAIAHAQRWTDEVRADASELTIPLGMPGDPAALVALTRLRSTLLAQGLPTAGRAAPMRPRSPGPDSRRRPAPGSPGRGRARPG